MNKKRLFKIQGGGRVTAGLLAAVLSLFVTATAANAATYVDYLSNSTISTFYSSSDPGQISVHVLCDSATLRADVSLMAMTPKAYPDGLYFYTQVYAKNHVATTWTLRSQGQSFVKSVSGYWKFVPGAGDMWVPTNDLKPLTSAYFYGADNNQYDVLVKYWWAPPGGTWRGPYGLPAQRFDNRSIIGLALPGSSTCYFDQ